MATQPVRTTTAKQILEALDEQERIAREKGDGDMDTYTRRYWTGQLDALKLARGIVAGLLPYAETDAVQRAMPGVGLTEAEFLLGDPAVADKMDEPSDPTLPFTVAVSA